MYSELMKRYKSYKEALVEIDAEYDRIYDTFVKQEINNMSFRVMVDMTSEKAKTRKVPMLFVPNDDPKIPAKYISYLIEEVRDPNCHRTRKVMTKLYIPENCEMIKKLGFYACDILGEEEPIKDGDYEIRQQFRVKIVKGGVKITADFNALFEYIRYKNIPANKIMDSNLFAYVTDMGIIYSIYDKDSYPNVDFICTVGREIKIATAYLWSAYNCCIISGMRMSYANIISNFYSDENTGVCIPLLYYELTEPLKTYGFDEVNSRVEDYHDDNPIVSHYIRKGLMKIYRHNGHTISIFDEARMYDLFMKRELTMDDLYECSNWFYSAFITLELETGIRI